MSLCLTRVCRRIFITPQHNKGPKAVGAQHRTLFNFRNTKTSEPVNMWKANVDTDAMNWIREQKKVVLHRHLEGYVPLRILWEYQQRGWTKSQWKTYEEMKQQVTLLRPMNNLQEVLDRFVHHQACFVSLEAVREITREVIIESAKEGIVKLELRFSPEFMAEPANLDWDEMMKAIIQGKADGIAAAGGNVQVGFIVIVSRNYGVESGMKTADFAKRWRDEIVGFDFAASEDHYPAATWMPIVKVIRELNLPLTVHSGEGTSAAHIESVLKLMSPERLGHATKLIDSEELMDFCRRNKVLVEACPTSNIVTNSVKSYDSHPLTTYLRRGIPVSLNDDDGTVFGVDLNDEWYVAHKFMGVSREELLAMNEWADKLCFISAKQNAK